MTRKRILLEATSELIRAWYLVRRYSFADYSDQLGVEGPGQFADSDPSDIAMAKDVRWAIRSVSRPFGEFFTCLMLAMAGKAMLDRRNIRNTLYLGAKLNLGTNPNVNSQTQDAKDMQAHAWLNVGPLVLLGGEEKEGYIPVVSYSGPVQRMP